MKQLLLYNVLFINIEGVVSMEDKKYVSSDVYLGILLTVIGVIFVIGATRFPSRASYLPIFSGLLLAIFSFAMMVFGIIKTLKVRQGKADYSKREVKGMPFLVFITILVYVFAVDKIGFFISSALFIVCEALLFKQRKILPIVLTILSLLGFLYWLFVIQLRISMPSGLLF